MNYLLSFFRSTPSIKPFTSAFSVSEVLAWSAENDPKLQFNKVTRPLAKKFTHNSSLLVGLFGEDTANVESQGTDIMNVYVMTFWQYIDIFVDWRGCVGQGIIVPPAPCWIEAGHKNGVKVFGNIFFASIADGGNIQWVYELATPRGAEQIIKIAKAYGFDGWFINQETTGGDQKLADQMKIFLQLIREQSEIEIIWYDSMDSHGIVSYQNMLDDLNSCYLVDDTKLGANLIFLNYEWDNQYVIDSVITADKLSLSPYQLLFGINSYQEQMQTVTTMEQCYSKNSPLTSVGLFLPNWTFKELPNITYEEFIVRDEKFWQSLAKLRSKATSLTTCFSTSFNRGQGCKYFIDGNVVNSKEWNDISQQDILPTFRFSDKIYVGFDFEHAYNGGSSFKLVSSVPEYTFGLFMTKINLVGNEYLHLTYKLQTTTGTAMIKVHFGVISHMYALSTTSEWTTISVPLMYKTLLTGISVYTVDNVTLHLGQLSIIPPTLPPTPTVKLLKTNTRKELTEVVVELNGAEYYYIYLGDVFITRASRSVWWFEIPATNERYVNVIGVKDGVKSEPVKIEI